MKYTSFGEYLIAERIKETKANDFGLITPGSDKPKYKVISAPFEYTDLKDKTVLIFSENGLLNLPDGKHVSFSWKNIAAVVD